MTVHAQQVDAPMSFARYRIPVMCAEAAAFGERQFWRDRRPDTVYHPRTGTSLQRSVVTTTRQCLDHFSLDQTKIRDLLGAGEAYLAAEENSRADSAFARLVAIASPANKPWVLSQIVDLYVNAALPNLPKALAFAEQLDALGAAAAPERMIAHLSIVEGAQFIDSVSLQARELNAALAAMHEMRGDTRKAYAFWSATVYQYRAALKARLNDTAGVRRELMTAREELGPLRPAVRADLDAALEGYRLLGQPSPTVQATTWFNTTDPKTARPVKGKPSLLVFVSHSCLPVTCYPQYAVLRRIAAKYGARLDITLITRTQGFYRNKLASPDSEMVFAKQYFFDYLKLPGVLAIWRSDLGHRDDGHLTVLTAPNDEAFHTSKAAFLVDSHGVIRLITRLSSSREAMLDDMIQSLL